MEESFKSQKPKNFKKNARDDKMSLPMDYGIRSSKVRVVDNESTRIMSRDDAIAEAKSQGMNLVQISFNPNVFPGSICKILDYAKFKYDQKKKQKEQNKKARASRVELKELSFTIRIDEADKQTKLKHAREFLNDGNMVKLSIFLTKREMPRLDYAKTLLVSIVKDLEDVSKLEKAPTLEGRNWSCIVSKLK